MSSGGKRENAGRPPSDPLFLKVPVGYKLPRWLVNWLRDQDIPAAQLIEEALCHQYNLTPDRKRNLTALFRLSNGTKK
jgi:hypothetical protein